MKLSPSKYICMRFDAGIYLATSHRRAPVVPWLIVCLRLYIGGKCNKRILHTFCWN